MAADSTVIGLTLAKINNVYHVDVRNARWNIRRANQQHVTGGGVKQSTGEEIPSGSFDEVIPRGKAFNWRALRNFSVEVFDKETRSILLFAAEGCNWTDISGSSDLSQAQTAKAVSWAGSKVVAEGPT